MDLDRVLADFVRKAESAAQELLEMIRALAGRWHQGRPGQKRDFEVGRLLEELLGIPANSSKSPDYKGIEIKASRRNAGTRQTLFAKVPDWSISPLKSSAQILDAFGYQRAEKYARQLRCTVSAKAPNTQGLFLVVENASGLLLEASTVPTHPKVAYWPVEGLQAALLAKHPETFWVSAACKKDGDREAFKYEHVLHTLKPMASALPTLLEAGTITVDHLITRKLDGHVSEQGPLFKIPRKNFDLLFPPGELYTL
ncbi:MvaI/BcnI restriction endonuclease family protein [Pseudoxanthomonas sp. NC8]|nr:MvaI/BcnI restriction endonuclease family protein [Pseudoxanthomonas sp. NC8]